MDAVEIRTIAKVTGRLVPFLIVCYFVAYLDRVNVGFAALTMNQDLGLSQTAFGFGAGIFFIAYFLFEVPSNLLLERFGARKWIARIMLSWGILSGLMAFIPAIGRATGLGNEYSFYLVRVLLGAAEAGFFPGIIFYLTLWFPTEYRARIVGYFMAAIPLSTVIGAPISGMLLYLHGGLGLAGWQWLFIIEALPALVLGFVVFAYLTDKPADATWLEPEERTALQNLLDAERRAKEAHQHFSLKEALLHPRVFGFGLIYLGIVTSLYGIGFWMPQIIKAFGLTNLQTGFVTAIPFLAGTIAMVILSRHSDRTMERVWHVAGPAFVGGAGFLWSAYTSDPFMGMVALTIASIGIFSALPIFWTLPTAILTGTAAAGGIAFINSVGNLGGFAGPYAIGWVKDATGSYASGMVVLAATLIGAGILTVVLGHRRESEVISTAPAE
jgi:MFS transporter, ACS family, tartrate transporter